MSYLFGGTPSLAAAAYEQNLQQHYQQQAAQQQQQQAHAQQQQHQHAHHQQQQLAAAHQNLHNHNNYHLNTNAANNNFIGNHQYDPYLVGAQAQGFSSATTQHQLQQQQHVTTATNANIGGGVSRSSSRRASGDGLQSPSYCKFCNVAPVLNNVTESIKLEPCGCYICKDCLIEFICETRLQTTMTCRACNRVVTSHSGIRKYPASASGGSGGRSGDGGTNNDNAVNATGGAAETTAPSALQFSYTNNAGGASNEDDDDDDHNRYTFGADKDVEEEDRDYAAALRAITATGASLPGASALQRKRKNKNKTNPRIARLPTQGMSSPNKRQKKAPAESSAASSRNSGNKKKKDSAGMKKQTALAAAAAAAAKQNQPRVSVFKTFEQHVQDYKDYKKQFYSNGGDDGNDVDGSGHDSNANENEKSRPFVIPKTFADPADQKKYHGLYNWVRNVLGGKTNLTHERYQLLEDAGFDISKIKKSPKTDLTLTEGGETELDENGNPKPKKKKRQITKTFEQRVQQYKDYMAEHPGATIVPRKYNTQAEQEKYQGLGEWLKDLRRGQVKLTDERKLLVEDAKIDLHKPVTTTAQQKWKNVNWFDQYTKLKKYAQEHGTTRVAEDHDDDLLKEWIGYQRRAKRSGILNQERRLLLDNIGMVWTEMEHQFHVNWREQYEKLKTYYEQNGTCSIPANPDTKLKDWIFHQRKVFRNGKLSDYRKQLLDDIEFNFTPKSKINKTEDDEDESDSDDSAVEGGKKKNEKKRRSRSTKKKSSKTSAAPASSPSGRSGMTPRQLERIERLWREQYQKLCVYQKEHKTTLIPLNYEDSKLRYWVITQRKAKLHGKLSVERQSLLDKINFVWSDQVSNEIKQNRITRKQKMYYGASGTSGDNSTNGEEKQQDVEESPSQAGSPQAGKSSKEKADASSSSPSPSDKDQEKEQAESEEVQQGKEVATAEI